MTPTKFEKVVVEIIKAAPNEMIDGGRLRVTLLERGFGKHPAAVAMNLTRLAWRDRYVTSFLSNKDRRVFILTSEGKAL